MHASNDWIMRVLRARRHLTAPVPSSSSEAKDHRGVIPPIFFSLATPADNGADRIASRAKGPHIGQYVSALFLRETSVPRRHTRSAFMNRLEQVGVGFFSDRW